MNKKLLCAALLAGLGVAQAASAQDATTQTASAQDATTQTYDNRWYVTSSVGADIQDSNRYTRNIPFVTLGFGRFISPLWSLDGELNYAIHPTFKGRNNINPANPNFYNVKGRDLNWNQEGISLDLRRHFIRDGRSWNPYLLGGIGYQRSQEEYDNFPNPNSPARNNHGNVAAKVGIGLQGDLGRVAIRTELAARFDANSHSHIQPNDSYFTDVLASIGVVIPLGAAPQAPVAPAPVAAPNCADMDDDGDGVNNCNDKCPGSQAGQTIGPDGCPVPVSIDLKGVNFDFDKSKLRPDAIVILNQAIDILKRYPQLKVEVAGHTDLCGSDAYNQKLSERRATAVYNYLTGNGIDAARLVGPTGYGESRPLEQTPQTLPACKSETNRRTELNVQN